MRDVKKQRALQLKYLRERRQAWLQENGPCKKCGSITDLEVDHIDPKTKKDHKVWSWSLIRRTEELAKCQVLCRECHKAKTIGERVNRRKHGTSNMYRIGCRCSLCRAVQTARVHAWRKKTGRH